MKFCAEFERVFYPNDSLLINPNFIPKTSYDEESDILTQKLNELEEKIVKLDKGKQEQTNSLDSMFSEDMINMILSWT